jgi:hypothetical protein
MWRFVERSTFSPTNDHDRQNAEAGNIYYQSANINSISRNDSRHYRFSQNDSYYNFNIRRDYNKNPFNFCGSKSIDFKRAYQHICQCTIEDFHRRYDGSFHFHACHRIQYSWDLPLG